MNCIVRYFPCSVTSKHHVAIYSSWLKPGSVTTQSRSIHRRSVRFFRMPWNRRRGRLIGSFVAESEGEGSVPDVGSTATDSEDTEGELDRLNGGYGRALYCGYYRARCHNDASQQRYRCRLCFVLCCKEACLAGPNGVCRHCTKAWPNAQNWLTASDPYKTLSLSSQHRTQLRSFGSDARNGRFSNTVHHGSFGNSLRHHSGQRSRSRSHASNLVGSCPICEERPKDHCLVPCGHRTCLQCGSRCLPICPLCRGTCTQCIRVLD
jgi:hypothetical protein